MNGSRPISFHFHPSCEEYREMGGGVLMSTILPNLNHSFICPVPVPFPDSVSGFQILGSGFLLFSTPDLC